MVVNNVLSLNVYLFNVNIVLAMNNMFGEILFSAQNSFINCESIFSEMDSNLPISSSLFKSGVRTVDSTSFDSCSWKYFSLATYSSLSLPSFSIREQIYPSKTSSSISSPLYALAKLLNNASNDSPSDIM